MATDTKSNADLFLSSLEKGKVARFFSVFGEWPVIPLFIIIMMVFFAVAADLISPHGPVESVLRARNTPPAWMEGGTWSYPLGADTVGRGILSRLFHGARISLLVMSVALVTGTLIGTALGLIAGYIGGLLDETKMRLVDIFFGIPFVLLAMVVGVVLGANLTTMVVMLALVTWSAFVRNIRAEVLSIRERDYVSLARVAGASTYRILIKHVLPGVINTIVVIATLRSGQLILTEAFLSFVGAGIPPPTPTWGGMIADGRNYLRDAWWISFFPGLFIFLIVLALNFIGDWLRDKLDPRLRQSS